MNFTDHKPLICLSLAAWEGNYTKSTLELVKEISRYRKVLFINYNYSWKDLITNPFTPKPLLRGRQKAIRKPYSDRELYVLNLPVNLPVNALPGRWYDRLLKWNAHINHKRIHWARKRLGIDEACWLTAFHPTMGLLLQEKYSHEDWFYYSYDNLSAARWAGKHGPRYEKAFIENVRGIIVSSDGLKERFASAPAPVHVVKNGVDLSLFRLQNVPINTGKVGYVGSVDNRINLDLMHHVIRHFPQLTFEFVGRVVDQNVAEELSLHANVRLAGAIPPDQLDSIMSSFDLGLIPFVKNEFTKNIYPLKINEYLVAGLPVVSTSFADLSDFNQMIDLADEPGEFCAAITQQLSNDCRELRSRRNIFARKNAWGNRAIQLDHILFPISETFRPNSDQILQVI